MEEKLAGLKRFNLIMGFLHLIQGVFMWVVSNETTYPIFTNYLNFNTETFSLTPNPQLFYELRFGPAVAVFLLISAVAHFYLSTIGNKSYVENLKKGMKRSLRNAPWFRKSGSVWGMVRTMRSKPTWTISISPLF